MTDIVEQAARVIYDTENYNRAVLEDAQVIAQALADAGLLAEPARTVPNRAAIAQALYINHRDAIGDNSTAIDLAEKGTDAVLELLAGKPTITEVKAEALEEAAEIVETHRQQRREAIGPIDENTMDPLLVQAHDSGSTALVDAKSLILARAQQIRDGK